MGKEDAVSSLKIGTLILRARGKDRMCNTRKDYFRAIHLGGKEIKKIIDHTNH